MGCLYWIIIGWWFIPLKWMVKLIYWIFIGWWIKLIQDETSRKLIFRILSGLLIASVIFFVLENYWKIIIPILILVGIALILPNSPLYYKEVFKMLNKKNPNRYDNIIMPAHLMNNIDPYFAQSGNLAISKGHLSTSDIQRLCRIGFSRAEHIIRQLEDCRVVSLGYGVEPRKTLMTQDEFNYLISSYHGEFKEYRRELIYQRQDLQDNSSQNQNNYDNMDGHQFEHYCAGLLKNNGFKDIEVTQGSGDHGIDILAEKDGITYAIQCKCYSSNIGNAAVQQAYTGKGFYHKDIAVVLTNRYFTPQAKEEAQALGVKLWDRDKLNELISNPPD